jgi:hypothetical protein
MTTISGSYGVTDGVVAAGRSAYGAPSDQFCGGRGCGRRVRDGERDLVHALNGMLAFPLPIPVFHHDILLVTFVIWDSRC